MIKHEQYDSYILRITFQNYQENLPQYIPPENFGDGDAGFHPISLNLTPQELHEMQEIVEDFDFEDQQEKNKLKTTLAMMHGNFICSLNINFISYTIPGL